MYRSRSITTLAALVLSLGASACGEPTAASSGTLSILLTDEPGDFKKAVVTIDQIYLQPSEDSDAGRVVLRDVPVTEDLLTLANATANLVSDAVVPSGSYTQLRFIISGAYIEVENADGSTSIYASSPSYAGLPAGAVVAGSLQMPSFALTGIKVNLPGGAVEISGDQRVLVVDFDVSRSFGQLAGTSNMWVMTPVLDATDFGATGSIAVALSKDASVTATVGDFTAVLTTAAGSREELALNTDGTGTFLFLAPGDYTLDFLAPEGVSSFTTNPTVPVLVSVGSGQNVPRAFVITAAN